MAPADNIRQRDQRVIRKFEKKKGRHRKMKKNVKRLIAGAVVLLVAAMYPKYVSRDEVDASYIEHEKEILLAQAKTENPEKPENIIEKMIIGRLNKEMKEICLLDQVYVQDSDLTVAKYVEKVAKENGANVTVKRFVRFETGEGLEKKEENFAEEVAKQMGN